MAGGEAVAKLMRKAVDSVGGKDTPLGRIAWEVVRDALGQELSVKEGCWVIDDDLDVVGTDGAGSANEAHLMLQAREEPPAMAYRLVEELTDGRVLVEVVAFDLVHHLALSIEMSAATGVDLKWVGGVIPIVVSSLRPLMRGMASPN